MSDEINWDIDNLRFMVRELNRKGIEVKNRVANIFWEFRYQVTPYWEGENYNNVISFVNEFVHYDGQTYGEGFKEKTDLVAYEIPRRIEDWINMQAVVDGQGKEVHFNLISAYDTGNSDVWEIPESVISKDGATRISKEKVEQFFIGTQRHSVKLEVEAAIDKLNEYVNIFDEYDQYTKGNSAAERSRQEVIDFRNRFIERTNYMLEVIIDVATQEINGIEQVDMETVRKAHEVANPSTDPCAPSNQNPTTYTNPCASSTDPCAPKTTPSTSWVDPCAPKNTPATTPNQSTSWTDPCAPKNTPATTPKPSTSWVDPCAPKTTPKQSTSWTDPCAPKNTSTTSSKPSKVEESRQKLSDYGYESIKDFNENAKDNKNHEINALDASDPDYDTKRATIEDNYKAAKETVNEYKIALKEEYQRQIDSLDASDPSYETQRQEITDDYNRNLRKN